MVNWVEFLRCYALIKVKNWTQWRLCSDSLCSSLAKLTSVAVSFTVFSVCRVSG